MFLERQLPGHHGQHNGYPTGWTIRSSNPGRASDLYLFQNVQPGYGALSASCSVGTEALSRGQSSRGTKSATRLLLVRAEINKEWSPWTGTALPFLLFY